MRKDLAEYRSLVTIAMQTRMLFLHGLILWVVEVETCTYVHKEGVLPIELTDEFRHVFEATGAQAHHVGQVVGL